MAAMGSWQQALATLESLSTRSILPDQICYSAAVAACAGAGRWMEGLALLQGMQQDRVEANERTFGAAISGCEKARQWPTALALLAEAQSRRSANSYCYNSAISACEKGGQWITALHLLSRMWLLTLQPDAFSFSSAASACEKGGAWGAALQLHTRMQEEGVQRNVISFGSLLAACVAGHRWGQAIHALSTMSGSRVTPNIVSYSAAMNACERGARGDLAMSLLKEAQHTLVPDSALFGVAVSACRRGSDWQTALHLSELCPEVATGIFTLQACEQGGNAFATVRFAAALRERVTAPSAELYQAFSALDELQEHALLNIPTVQVLEHRSRPAMQRLHTLAGSIKSRGPTWRLHEPILEEQPSLGWVFTVEALNQLKLLGPATGARLHARRELCNKGIPEEVGSQAIVAWLAYQVNASGAGHRCSLNRCVAFGAGWGRDNEPFADGMNPEQCLVPILREHDRSQHAERKALLAVAGALGKDTNVCGSVRLYASHTLCISCLAVCCQFRGLCTSVAHCMQKTGVRRVRRSRKHWSFSQGLDLVADCRRVFSAHSLEREESESVGATYWLSTGATPACALEQLVLEICDWHKDRLGLSNTSGAEWWTLWMDGEEDDVGWHWDADYESRQRGETKHPSLGTVTYLEAGGSVAPTAILEGCHEPAIMAGMGSIVHVAHLSLPVRGKHICFDGTLLHAAPVELRDAFNFSFNASDKLTGKKRSTRTTLLVNIWCGHVPRDPQRLPAEMASKLSPVTVTSSFGLGSSKVSPSVEVVVGRGVRAQEMSWSFGELDNFSVALSIPDTPTKADNLTLRFTDGRCGCVG
ncbi:unnamed protein product [Durusdinium trenchii]|uniref:Pentatricopeptide repeat-containing protein, chloroplastic n=1 Tax=Durusdinium trenchii TaxID=1381693 RepID=A0ABP0JKT8_9DINO